MKSFRWLQFSDLHLYPHEKFDKVIAKKQLLVYLKEERFDPDYIFFTGDIADRCNYDATDRFIKEILEAANVPPENAFWSVGNHDIKRYSKVNDVLAESDLAALRAEEDLRQKQREDIIVGIRQADDQYHAFVEAMSDTTKREILTKHGMKDYIEKYNALFPTKKGARIPADKITDAHTFYPLDELNLLVLNTCLTSCNDEDEQNLMIAEDRLDQVFHNCAKEGNEKPFIVIGHHGIDFLQEDSNTYLLTLFDNYKVDFYLCGHAHELGYKLFSDLKRNVHQITSGGLSLEDTIITFAYGEFHVESCSMGITIHSYADRGDRKWHADYSRHQRLGEDSQFFIHRLFPVARKQLCWPAFVMAACSVFSLIPQFLRGFKPLSVSVSILGLVFALGFRFWSCRKIPGGS